MALTKQKKIDRIMKRYDKEYAEYLKKLETAKPGEKIMVPFRPPYERIDKKYLDDLEKIMTNGTM